jgi:hypothetical protein
LDFVGIIILFWRYYNDSPEISEIEMGVRLFSEISETSLEKSKKFKKSSRVPAMPCWEDMPNQQQYCFQNFHEKVILLKNNEST